MISVKSFVIECAVDFITILQEDFSVLCTLHVTYKSFLSVFVF